jgi:hypothetical protein
MKKLKRNKEKYRKIKHKKCKVGVLMGKTNG